MTFSDSVKSYQRIYCSHFAKCFPFCKQFKYAFYILSFVKPSSILSQLRTKAMFEISCTRQSCRAANISSIICFSLVRDPLLIMSNNDFESFCKCRSIAFLSACSNCDWRACASSNKSAKAITSADNTERVTLLD